MIDKRKIGEKLKKIRDSRGLTQKSFAEICGISQVQVTRYENGIHKPTQKILTKICEGLDIPMEYLDESYEVTDSVLDAEYQRCKNSLLDPEDKFMLAKFLKLLYFNSQSKNVLKEPVGS